MLDILIQQQLLMLLSLKFASGNIDSGVIKLYGSFIVSLVKYNNNSISAVTSAASIPSGAMTHIKTLTASNASNITFIHGTSDVVFDSTYPIYVFKFINFKPATVVQI